MSSPSRFPPGAAIGVLDRGRVVELGTYDELLAHGGRFAEFVAGDRPLESEVV